VLKVLLVVMIVAVATYALVRVIQRRGVQSPLVNARRRPTRPSGPVGPDDDEEFLRELDRKRLRRPEDPDS
jgi:hypothetical protein